jgi:hypothetical protein
LQITSYTGKKPIHAILAYQIKLAMEEETYLCNAYISNANYTTKGNPSMLYLHVALKPT